MTDGFNHPELELSSYLDDVLDAVTRGRIETHLETCAACTALLAELRGIVAHAQALEDRVPETDLWEGIAARMNPAPPQPLPLRETAGRVRAIARRFTFTFPQLAAAALFVALLSGSAVWWIAGSRALHPAAGTAVASRGITQGTPTEAPDASTADFEIHQYDRAVADLQRVLSENRSRLDPETVKAVETNLAVIDAAILQARKALVADPANPYLTGHLADQMKRKIRLLQRTSDAVTVDFSGGNS